MINAKEISIILLITIILAVTISLIKSIDLFLYTLLIIFSIIMINVIAKKITSFYFNSEIKIKLWKIKKYGFKPHAYFKNPFPAGVFLPIIITAFSFGYLTWMASLVFEIKPKVHRAAKRHGLYSFTEIRESHLGYIASAGILANLALAIAAYLLNIPDLARLNIYYVFFNIIPISNLDGNKIYFGNKILWSFLASIILIALIISIIVI